MSAVAASPTRREYMRLARTPTTPTVRTPAAADTMRAIKIAPGGYRPGAGRTPSAWAMAVAAPAR